MDERRKSHRARCLLGARVVFNARSSTMSCTVKNHSEEGALLLFGETPYIPNQIELVLDNRRTLMPAEILWRSGCKVGIGFPRGRFLAELGKDAAGTAFLLTERTSTEAVH
jgi:hypothetical protein